MRKFWTKVKEWCKANIIILVYFVCAVLIEMTAVFVVEGSPFFTRPFLSLGLLVFICGIIFFVKGNRARTVVCAVMLALQAILDLVFSVIYDMTDQYFDFGMFNLRNDAFAILENVPVDFVTFYVGLFVCVMFLIFGLRYARSRKKVRERKRSAFYYSGLILAGIATVGISFATYFPSSIFKNGKTKYDEMVTGRAQTAYSAYGMTGNLLGELGKTMFNKSEMADDTINEFIYKETSNPTEYFGVSEGKNVVTILGESFEWFTFLRGDSADSNTSNVGEYGKALDIPQATLKMLYPNLTAFYEESVVMTNFHSREKTDTSEATSILGSYPTGAYINYEYAKNTVPHSLPNVLKLATGGEIYANSFHNGFKTFYNRHKAHPMLGFESLTDMYDMEKMSNEIEKEGGKEIFYNYMDKGERNLDSQMLETAKDLMFPTDGRFYTYITTLTMHGMYYDRKNLRAENNERIAEQVEMLQQYKPKEEEFESAYEFHNAEALFYYMTTGLEFDQMLGLMKADLQAKGLWENTTIVLFGDHNAYYENLSNYVKEIEGYDSENKFTDLYNVPLMIHDGDLVKAMAEKGDERIIDKFVCTADIVPTLLDLLGIRYYSNLYYGHSVFADEQSVLYSRIYDIFLSDGVLRRSVKDTFYEYDGLTETGVPVADTIAAFEKEGVKLVEKIKYCDYIFKQDHFGNEAYFDLYESKMKTLNGWV